MSGTCKNNYVYSNSPNVTSTYHTQKCISTYFCFIFVFKYINKTGFRVCLKELYETKYDPLSVSYAVLSGIVTRIVLSCNFLFYSMKGQFINMDFIFLRHSYLTDIANITNSRFILVALKNVHFKSSTKCIN